MMNQYVDQFGLKNTHLKPYTVLITKTNTPPRDMALIGARIILRDLPEEYHIYAEKSSPSTTLNNPTVTAYYGTKIPHR